MNVNDIPTLTALRTRLGFHEPGTTKVPLWYREAKNFRLNHKNQNGIPGRSFKKWTRQDHQLGLAEMTCCFLDTWGNGQRFWPGNALSPNGLDYSKQHARIKEDMKMLFYRLNKQDTGRPSVQENQERRDGQHDAQTNQHPEENPGNPKPTTTSSNPVLSTNEDCNAFIQDILSRPLSRLSTNELPLSPYRVSIPPDTSGQASPAQDPYEVPPSSGGHLSAKRRPSPLDNDQSRSPKRPKQTIAKPTTKGTPATPRKKKQCNETPKSYPPRERKSTHKTGYVYDLTCIEDLSESSGTAANKTGPTERNIRQSIESSFSLDSTAPQDTADSLGPIPIDESWTAREDTIDTVGRQQKDGPFRYHDSPFRAVSQMQASPEPPLFTEEPMFANTQTSVSHPICTPAPPTSRARLQRGPKVDLIFSQQLSPGKTTTWTPKGGFEKKALREVIEELPVPGDFHELIFRVKTMDGRGMRTDDRIPCDNEQRFQVMKKRFNRDINEFRARMGRIDPLSTITLEVEIEPVGTVNGDDSVDEIEEITFI